ncbi:MAG TPA: cytochrome c biogenesis protein CcsA [Gemmatimonadaceae bacterium]|nr:cytochrome c biogenesis protein CcsA [Gemmatimonadaceae bacterium]
MSTPVAAPPAPPRIDDRAPAAAPPLFDWLFALAVAAVVAAVVRVIFFTPTEATQGLAQKIYYIHVPAALSAYLALTVCALLSILYLWLHDVRADHLAESAGEVGLLFTTVVLSTGPLWGKPIWGAWWTWDARLTLTLFLWFVAAAYLVLRGAIDEPAMRARYSAVLAVLAVLLIPFIHLSVYLFRTLHPMPIVLKPDRPSLPSEMLVSFLFSSLAFLFFCAMLIRARYRLALRREAQAVPV